MRKRTHLAALAAAIFFLGLVGVSPAGSQDMCAGAWVNLESTSSWAKVNSLRGRGTANSLSGVLLFAADISFITRCEEPNIESAVLREAAWVLDTNIPASSWQGAFLVLDDNNNLKADSEEKRFPVEISSGMLRVRDLNIKVRYQEKKSLLLIANLAFVREKDYIALKFADAKHMKIEPEGKVAYSFDLSVVFTEVLHYRGNRAPELYFPWLAPYSNKFAVFPGTGSPQEEFEFSVVYRDEDGDRPAAAEVWIDENDNGVFEANEHFPMTDLKPDITYREYHLFSFKRSFPGLNQKGVKFKFRFADSESQAIKGNAGNPTPLDPATVFEIQFNQNILVEVGELPKSGYLPGEIISVKLGVLVYFQGAIEIDWKDFRKNVNPKLFVFKGLSVGERRYFSKTYDIEEAVMFLEAPSIRAEKKYAVDLPPLSFVAKVDGRAGKIGVPSFKVPVTLKSRVEGPFVDQLLVRVGEPIMYRVRSVRLVQDRRFQELERLTFKPFVEVGRVVKTTRNKNLVIEDFVFTLMLFEHRGQYQIPAFSFPFGKLAGFTVTLLPSKGTEKLILPYNERGLRTIPASPQRMAGGILFTASVLILVVLVRRPLWRGLVFLARFRLGRTWQDRVRKAHDRVREAVTLAEINPCHETLLALYDHIRFYFIAVADAANSGKFAGADARTFQKALTGSIDSAFLATFVELEDSLMSSGRFEAGELLAKLDQTTRAVYAQLN